jgi:spermidine/putrescine transport system substrate-binding protein
MNEDWANAPEEDDSLSRGDFVLRAAALTGALAGGASLVGARKALSATDFLSASYVARIEEKVGGSIDFLSWEGYDLPKSTAAWRKKHGVKVRSTYIATHDDIQAKLKTSSTHYDLISYSQNYADLYHELDILTPIPLKSVPNVKRFYPLFRKGRVSNTYWVKNGVRYGVPFIWTTQSCVYRSDLMPTPRSWHDLLKPEFKGKVGWGGGAGAFIVAGAALGYKPPNFTRNQFKKIVEFMKRMRDQTPSGITTYGDLANLFVSGDVTVAFNAWTAVALFATQKGAKNIRSVIPKEGSASYVDAYAIPPSADNVDSARAFINAVISPRIQALGAVELVAGVMTPKAVPLIKDKNQRRYSSGSNLKNVFAKAPLYKWPPFQQQKGSDVVPFSEWVNTFAALKAGQ